MGKCTFVSTYLNFGTRWVEWLALRPWRFASRKKLQVHYEHRAGWTPLQLWTLQILDKSLVLARNRTIFFRCPAHRSGSVMIPKEWLSWSSSLGNYFQPPVPSFLHRMSQYCSEQSVPKSPKSLFRHSIYNKWHR